MFIRFQGAILLAALTAVVGGALEKSILDRRRAVVRQHEQIEALRERVARARLRTERLGALTTLVRPLEDGRLELAPVPSSDQPDDAALLLHWRYRPERR